MTKDNEKTLTGYPSIDKPWLKYYSEEAARAKMPRKTLYQYVYENNKEHLDDIAMEYFYKKISYKKMFENIDRIASSLIGMGLKSGDRVALFMANMPECVYLFYAINRLGAVSVFLDPRLKDNEIISIIKEVSPAFAFYVSMKRDMSFLDDFISSKRIVSVHIFTTCNGLFGRMTNSKHMSWNKFVKLPKRKMSKNFSCESSHPAIMVHTGGSTGVPKTVILSNDALNTLVFNNVVGGYKIKRQDKFLSFLPPFYAYGICGNIHLPLCMGCRVRILPKFDASDFPKLMKKEKPNVVFGGPILYDKMIHSRLLKNSNLSFFRFPISGGDTMNLEFEKRVNSWLKRHNCHHRIQQGYGLTESASSVCYAKEGTTESGSVGIPYVKNTISIFDIDNGNELKYMEKGEICILSSSIMNGYFNNEEETNSAIKIHKDGKRWLHTGDIGYMNKNGNLFVIGRIKRMIVSNGAKIFPLDIENLIMKNHHIEAVAVVGMSEPNYLKVPVVHLIVKQNQFDNGKVVSEIDKAIEETFPDYYKPWLYIIRKNMPLTNVNKIDYESLGKEVYELDGEKVVDIRNE